MKSIHVQMLMPAALLLMVSAGAGTAGNEGARGATSGFVQAKQQYCMDCHGVSGRGYRGYFTMPRLAGQTPEYLENQLRAFVEGHRDRNFAMRMSRVHGVSPAMRSALAVRFARLNPAPLGSGPKHLIAAGRKIYEEGQPDANVPACAACHGPHGEGAGQNARLAGQFYSYMVDELLHWSSDRGHGSDETDPANVMRPVAKVLTKSQASAVAAYLSSLR